VWGEVVFDVTVAGDGLTGIILIPVVPRTATDEGASVLFEVPDKVDSFHAMRSSATCRVSPCVM